MRGRAKAAAVALVTAAGMVCALPGEVLGCPKCKVATGDLASDDTLATAAEPIGPPAGADADPDATAATEQSRKPLKGLSLAIGADVPTAYFFRGYLQQDRGFIFQPFLTISTTLGDASGANGWSVQPYLGWWNSFHDQPVDSVRGGHGRHNHTARTETRTERYLDPGHAGNEAPHFHTRTVNVFIPGNAGSGKGWYETEAMAGVTLVRGDWFIDLSYRAHFFPEDTHDFVHEVGGKVSYDLAGLWDDRRPGARDFSLRPWLTVYRELADHNGDENTYVEIGLEPTWRTRVFGQRLAISTPVLLGGSPDGYYYDSADDDALLGYVSGSLKASLALPVPEKFGHWYLNGSVTYLQLLADSAEEGNRGDSSEIIGAVGIGVSF